jgi:cation diffusion facilitator family transporter
MEYLCSLFISTIVTVLGIELFISSVKSIIGGGDGATYSTLSIVIMATAVLVKVGLAVFYSRVGKKIDSAALKASAADSIGDVCATLAVILGIVLTPVIGPMSDGIFGALIAIYIFVMGVKLIIDSSSTLIGTPPDVELIKAIVTKIKSYDGVIGIHDLVVHNYGVNTYFATVHVEMDADRDVMESHDLIDNIEKDFYNDLSVETVIHLDPVIVDDPVINDLREHARAILVALDSELTLHDFRAVVGPTHTNVIFDIVLPPSHHGRERELKERFDSLLKAEHPECNTVITFDHNYN